MAGQDLSRDQIRRMNAMLEELAAGGFLDGVSDEDKADPQYVTELYTKQVVDPRANQFTVDGDTGNGMLNTSADFSIAFVGIQPQFKQIPPKCSFSTSATDSPNCEALIAAT